MSQFQLFNGEFYTNDETLLPVSNRGFCYGDGFFESMRVFNCRLPFATEHWKRLQRATAFLGIVIPTDLNEKSFEKWALQLVERNGFKNARVRFQGFRMGEGRYTPETNLLGWSMVCQELDTSEYRLNSIGLKVAFCDTHRINPAPQSSFKSSNSLPYILGGMFASKHGLDDCFLLDINGSVAEATGSNIILVKGHRMLTPDLKFGGVPGVMRTILLKEAGKLGYSVEERPISREDILEADECLLCNAARGVQWVSAVEKKRYFKKVATKLTEQVNQSYGLSS